jgi:hypothetical protein
LNAFISRASSALFFGRSTATCHGIVL